MNRSRSQDWIKTRQALLACCLGWLGGWLGTLATTPNWPGKVAVRPSTDVRIDFDTQIAPLFSCLGCNAAACHGAAGGRGGFQLSLFGSDLSVDFDQVVRERMGRRVHRTEPAESLLLLKATAWLNHEGGERIAPGSEEFRLIRDWIAQGARRLRLRALTELVVEPASATLSPADPETPLRVTARFDDGSAADVTRIAVIQPLDPEAVKLEGSTATVLRPGQHAVLVRYLSEVRLVELLLPEKVSGTVSEPDSSWSGTDTLIDRAIARRLAELGIESTGPADPATLYRRWSLDLAGRLPEPEAMEDFVRGDSPQRRLEIVDQFLASEQFSQLWTWHVAEWLRIGGNNQPQEIAAAWQDWLKREIAGTASVVRLARESLTASGPVSNGATGFYRLTNDPRLQAEQALNAWMGVRIGCANCHNHPLDHWTRDDYYRLAACFAGVQRGARVEWTGDGTLLHPVNGQAVESGLPDGTTIKAGDPRARLADWLTVESPEQLARSSANRVWRILMGQGLYEPVDDWRETNPVANRQLLDELARVLADNEFQLRPLIKAIVLSNAYQRRSTGDPASPRDRFTWRFMSRPLPPPVMLTAIEAVTHADRPPDSRYFTQARPMDSPELRLFGQCDRSLACAPSAGDGTGLAAQLEKLTGSVIVDRIQDREGWLAEQMAIGQDDAAMLRELYQRCYSRAPTHEELRYWLEVFKAAGESERPELWADLIWGVLASEEFSTVR